MRKRQKLDVRQRIFQVLTNLYVDLYESELRETGAYRSITVELPNGEKYTLTNGNFRDFELWGREGHRNLRDFGSVHLNGLSNGTQAQTNIGKKYESFFAVCGPPKLIMDHSKNVAHRREITTRLGKDVKTISVYRRDAEDYIKKIMEIDKEKKEIDGAFFIGRQGRVNFDCGSRELMPRGDIKIRGREPGGMGSRALRRMSAMGLNDGEAIIYAYKISTDDHENPVTEFVGGQIARELCVEPKQTKDDKIEIVHYQMAGGRRVETGRFSHGEYGWEMEPPLPFQ